MLSPKIQALVRLYMYLNIGRLSRKRAKQNIFIIPWELPVVRLGIRNSECISM
jgi:hypothetical protein